MSFHLCHGNRRSAISDHIYQSAFVQLQVCLHCKHLSASFFLYESTHTHTYLMDMCIYTCPSNISGDCIASPRLLAQQTHFCIPSFSILSSRCPLQSFPICCGLSLLNLVFEDIENISCSEHSKTHNYL